MECLSATLVIRVDFGTASGECRENAAGIQGHSEFTRHG